MSLDSTTPTVHPYVRISDPLQRKGGGLVRQTTANIEEFCKRFGFKQSKRLWIDDGVSAWKGLNATPDHELGKFLIEAKKGLIRPGDCLLVENYDRLSRQSGFKAMGLIGELQELSIHVGRLDRMKLLRYDSDDQGDFFEAAMELLRGNSESNAKSFRNGKKWEKNREEARKNGTLMTLMFPDWLEEVGGKLHPKAGAVETIKRIFRLAIEGYGHARIVRLFTEKGVPAFGTSGRWGRSYIGLILKDRRVLGEFQPHLSNGDSAGDAIKNYYPAIIDEETWYAARAATKQRSKIRGRQAKHINVFAGLVKNALEGDSYYFATRVNDGKPSRVLINTNAAEGRSKTRSFPFDAFEKRILERLREIDPHTILNGDSGPDETTVLRGQLETVESELAARKAFMEGKPFSPTIGQQILELETRQRELAEELSAARERAAHPLSEAWGEGQTLMDAIDNAADPEAARVRLQSVLRRIVDTIMLLVVPRGRDRLAAVQVWFAGEKEHRDYLIFHRPAKANASARTEGGSWCRSMLNSNLPGVLDLRNRDDARKLESVLAQMEEKDWPTR